MTLIKDFRTAILCPYTRIAGQKNNRYNGKENKTMISKERKRTAPPRYEEAFKAGTVRMPTKQCARILRADFFSENFRGQRCQIGAEIQQKQP